MRNFLVILGAMFFYTTTAQTFSLIIDPVEGEESTFHNNALIEIGILEDNLIVTGQHFCKPDPGTNVSTACSSLSSFNLQGEHLNSILIDTFFNTNQGGLLVDNNRIFLASFMHDVPSVGRNLNIQEFDANLTLIDRIIVPSTPNNSMNNDGIKRIDDNYYVYGVAIYQACTKGVVQKLDLDFNLLWTNEYIHGATQNGCDKLQKADDDNLIFMHEFSKGQTGTAGNSGLQIVKINSDGTKLDSLQLDVSTLGPNALLSDSQDMIYVYTPNHPTPTSVLDLSQGSLNKYSNNLDTLIWSLRLPHNNFVDGRSYYITNINEARNGDILICGSVFDYELYGPFFERESHVNSGFIARVTKDGKISWLRLYKSPNINPQLPVKEFGFFHNSILANLTELEDGRIIAGGTSSLNTPQSNEIIGSNEALSQFLILAVDGETGCIEGEECDEVIILDKQYRPRDKYLPIINPDYQWTISQADVNGAGHLVRYTYQVDSIEYDTLPDGTIYEAGSLDPSSIYTKRVDLSTVADPDPKVLDLYREIGGRIYQKFEGALNEKLIFDIHLQSGESIEVYSGGSYKELQAIATDTVVFLDGVPRKRIFLNCLSEPISSDTIVWVEGIGELDNSKVCNFEGQESLVLCVQDYEGNEIYSLNENSCQNSIDACQDNIFEIGGQWTFEEYIILNNYTSAEIRPFTFEIVDSIQWKGRQAFVVDPGLTADFEYMVQEEDRIYYWDELLGEYQLTYDFNNDSVYHIRYFDFIKDQVDSTAVFIDSIRVEQFAGKEIQVQYCSSELAVGTVQQFKIYEGIGRANVGVRFHLNLVDGFIAGDLRCYESEDCEINFLDMPCDTIIEMDLTSTKNLESSLDINLYPNPIQDEIYLDVEGQDWEYQIFNLQGQQMLQGVYQDYIHVDQLPAGIYFLQLRNEDILYRALKFIKE